MISFVHRLVLALCFVFLISSSSYRQRAKILTPLARIFPLHQCSINVLVLATPLTISILLSARLSSFTVSAECRNARVWLRQTNWAQCHMHMSTYSMSASTCLWRCQGRRCGGQGGLSSLNLEGLSPAQKSI